MSFSKRFACGLMVAGVLCATSSSFAGGYLPSPEPVSVLHSMPNWYFTGFGGASYLDSMHDITPDIIRFKTYYDFGAAVGLRMRFMRLEAQYTYADAPIRNVVDIDSGVSLTDLDADYHGHQKMNAGMANLYFDVQPCDLVGIYVGGGVGAARFTQRSVGSVVLEDGDLLVWDTSDVQTKFAYQAMAGITINTDNQFYVDLGYRYLTTKKLDEINERPVYHFLNLGITYHIPA